MRLRLAQGSRGDDHVARRMPGVEGLLVVAVVVWLAILFSRPLRLGVGLGGRGLRRAV